MGGDGVRGGIITPMDGGTKPVGASSVFLRRFFGEWRGVHLSQERPQPRAAAEARIFSRYWRGVAPVQALKARVKLAGSR